MLMFFLMLTAGLVGFWSMGFFFYAYSALFYAQGFFCYACSSFFYAHGFFFYANGFFFYANGFFFCAKGSYFHAALWEEVTLGGPSAECFFILVCPFRIRRTRCELRWLKQRGVAW